MLKVYWIEIVYRQTTFSFPFYKNCSWSWKRNLSLYCVCYVAVTCTLIETWSLIANFGIYDFSSYAVAGILLAHLARNDLCLNLDLRKISGKGYRSQSKFQPIEHSMFRSGNVVDSKTQYPAACHVTLPFSFDSSCLFILPLSRHPSEIVPFATDEIQKIRGTFSPPSKGKEKGSCTSSTEVASAKLRYKKANKFLTGCAFRGTFYFSRRSSDCSLARPVMRYTRGHSSQNTGDKSLT